MSENDGNYDYKFFWNKVNNQVNFLSDKRIYNAKKTYFNCKKKKKKKIKSTIGLKNELKYSPMSEGNTCIAEPNLEVLPLRIIQ